jgi:uncharacterized protein YcfL
MKQLAIIALTSAAALLAGCSSSQQAAAVAESVVDTVAEVVTTPATVDDYEVIVDPKSGQRTVIDRATGRVVR